MKIQYLHIQNYKQFFDLELDLTYPKGHPKEGEPLDKICIIGQSGTGKTNLLDIIKKSSIDFSEQPENSYLPFFEFVGRDTDDRYITGKFTTQEKNSVETLFTKDKSKITFQNKNDELLESEKNYFVSATKDIVQNKEALENDTDISKMSSSDKILLNKLTNAKAELVLDSINEDKKSATQTLIDELAFSSYNIKRKKTINEKRREINNAIAEIEDRYTTVSKSLQELKSRNFSDRYIININDKNNSWELLQETIDNYDTAKNIYKNGLISKLLEDDNYTKDKFKSDMAYWEEKNQNILEKIADDINDIIKKFNLELKINEHTQNYDELLIKDLSNGMVIKYEDLSTGTKNLLSTFIPLKSYKPKDSIILIDEPEMSFYPNIQRQLTDLYMNVGENNQLVMATHSPLIASSFEPWEVVELKFNKNNQIYREKYYEGENHVDNYTLDPRMLTWTGILTDVFDLQEDSNFSFREKKLMEYATLKAEIKTLDSVEEKEKKFKELKKISKILGLDN